MSSSACADLAKSRAFYVDCLGYMVTDEDKDALYLRGVEERNHHSIVLRKSDEPRRSRSASRSASEEDLDKRRRLASARKGCRRRCAERAVSGPHAAHRRPASACRSSFYFKMDAADRILQKYAAYKGARIQRIDHFNCFTPDVQASYDFYTELGFRLTEYTETEGADPKLWAVWMQRKGSVHDLAFTNGRGPRLHHIGVWSASALDILHTCDVMATDRLSRQHGARPRPARHLQRLLPLRARSRRPPRRAVHLATISRSIPTSSRSAGRCDDPQRQTLWGASGAEDPGSRKARRSPACRCASQCSRRGRSWRGKSLTFAYQREASLSLGSRPFGVN